MEVEACEIEPHTSCPEKRRRPDQSTYLKKQRIDVGPFNIMRRSKQAQELAATIIQKFVRGFLTRRETKRFILEEEKTANLLLPITLISKSRAALLHRNFFLKIQFLTDNTICIPRGRKIDLEPIFSLTPRNYDILEALNPNLRFELVEHHLIVKHIMSIVSANIHNKIGATLENLNGAVAFPGHGIVATEQAQFLIPATGSYLSADVSFMSHATYNAMGAYQGTRMPGVPEFVVEVRSPSQTSAEQRDKMAVWIQAGVDCCVLVDPVSRVTRLYATTASGMLPAIGAANTIAHPNDPFITEESFPWPALPALVGGRQGGPALVVNIPAGSAVVGLMGAIALNHATWIVGKV
eukprot:TRINITY_DN6015_c0_g1_i1.p1 TRINITY_DN6015_c0_g1~~TRINITY_DN6015_c0_g1_i1.p1  ORF type:complete len:362 (+),score=49.74 TRINITY_DN6015_c0_g1_i1:33-1088(+)